MPDMQYAADMRTAALTNLAEELESFKAAGFDGLHFDIMDGRFAPHLGLGIELIQAAKAVSPLTCHAHLMIEAPEKHIGAFINAGCERVTVHLEAGGHLHRTLSQIRDAGASPGIAVLPATPLIKLEYVLPLVDRIVVTAGLPDYSPAAAKDAHERVRILNENIRYHEYAACIEVDSDTRDPQDAAKLAHFGARSIVISPAILSSEGRDIASALACFKTELEASKETV